MDHKNEPITATLVNQNNFVRHMHVCLHPYSNTCVSACAHRQTHTERQGGGREKQREGRRKGGTEGDETREERVLIHYLGNDFSQMILNAVIP